MATEYIQPLESYRELFPVTRERAYLNHAALGTLSTPVAEALAEHIARHSRLGADEIPHWRIQQQRVREKMASFVGAKPGEIATARNTPDALSLAAAGLPWQPGDRIVICDLEYPANVFPWLNLAKRGVETVVVRSREGAVPTEAVLEAIDDRTRLVALSWVEFTTGYRNDLKTIGQFCHQRGALLAVDAMQGLGALRLDVKELNIDFFGAASHKWLLSPAAVGWFYCREELVQQLDLAIIGQGSYERGPTTSLLDYGRRLWPDSRRFEPGLGNFLPLAGLEAALDLLAGVGIERIEAQVKGLTDLLAEGLQGRGYRLAAARNLENWSGIVSFSSERHPSELVFHRLEESGVSVSLREGLVRASPHFYNNEGDIERLLTALP